MDIKDEIKSTYKFGFVIGLELLDNLPHDKLFFQSDYIYETWISEEKQSSNNTIVYKEVRKFTEDKQILEQLNIFLNYYDISPDYLKHDNYSKSWVNVLWYLITHPTTSNPLIKFKNMIMRNVSYWIGISNLNFIIYLPTGSYNLIQLIENHLPQHEVLFADFSYIQTNNHGFNGPLIQITEGNKTIEKSTYLEDVGKCDIFFPTNFDNLKLLYSHILKKNGKVERINILTTKEFMKKYADIRSTKTKMMYNPLLEDFVNTKFFIKKID